MVIVNTIDLHSLNQILRSNHKQNEGGNDTSGSPSFTLASTVRSPIVVQHIFFSGYTTFRKQRLYTVTLLTFEFLILEISNWWGGSFK